jgi:uncharacterized membrane protein HdeD (DUF308 family)
MERIAGLAHGITLLCCGIFIGISCHESWMLTVVTAVVFIIVVIISSIVDISIFLRKRPYRKSKENGDDGA